MLLPKEFSIQEIAGLLGGRIEGAAETKVKSVAMSPLKAQPGDLVFAFEPKVIAALPHCQASAVIVPEGTTTSLPAILVERPLIAVAKMLEFAAPKRYLPEKGVHPTALVDPSCELGTDVAIGPYVVIGPHCKIGAGTTIMAQTVIGGKVRIGASCLIHPGCLIADYVQIGDRVVLQQGVSLGADGFGFATQKISNLERRMNGDFNLVEESNPHIKIPQIGTVIIGDDVEIGAFTAVDRATMGATIIGQGTKIDNLVQIGHNVKVGEEVLIVSLTAIGGSATIEDRAVIAGHVAIKDHILVGKDAIVEGKAGVMKNVPARDVVLGSPAFPVKEFMRNVASVRRLPKMQEEIRSLKQRLAELERSLQEPLDERKLAKT